MDVQIQNQGITRIETPRPETTRTPAPRPEVTREATAPAETSYANNPSTNSLLASIVESNGHIVNDLVTDAQIDSVVADLNQILAESGRQIQHGFHEDTNTILVRVINTYTGEVIRELPEEERLDVLFTLREALGININASV